ncbi:MAG: heparinase II/III family protein [Sphaerochaeta sp.]|jgi:DNA-directed RNA polymerase subunit RPC12/RpoP|nr:heparinase II/III family protein [Sphaerochaeta sp.]
MIQFTEAQIKDFRSRGEAKDAMVAWLRKDTHLVREHQLVIPQTGIATWELFYFCPDCSVHLTFDIDKPEDYECPHCHKVFHGEPYRGAWWRQVNTVNFVGAYHLGLLYLLTEDHTYALRAKEILLGYAKVYPSYQIHGDIPYNNPGKANAQTLCEAIFLRNFACCYDLIEDTLTEEEKRLVKENLFRPGSEVLMKYRKNHLHNHEVIVDSSLGVLALILDDKKMRDFALYEKYGLYYQLEHGMLDDGSWFECSTCYHFFAVQNFFDWEQFALNTPYGNIQHPNYRKMILFALHLLKPDYTFPLLNDSQLHQGNLNAYGLFEFAYAQFKDDQLLRVLHIIYQTSSRCDLQSFFYGVRNLPLGAAELSLSDYHDDTGSGLTVLHQSRDQYLVFRHGPFGGEHDHYDRLGISYACEGQPVSEDMGTTGYGAILHYDYYKNTGTHNTVMLDEENQAPSRGRVLRYEPSPSGTLVDAQVNWDGSYQVPDSFTIRQWSENAYRGAKIRRQLLFTDAYLADVIVVSCPEERKIDNVFHFGGTRISGVPEGATEIQMESVLSKKKPFSHLSDVTRFSFDQMMETRFAVGDVQTELYSFLPDGETVYAQGLDNPSTRKIPFFVERKRGTTALFVHVLSSHKGTTPLIDEVSVRFHGRDVIIIVDGASHRFEGYCL